MNNLHDQQIVISLHAHPYFLGLSTSPLPANSEQYPFQGVSTNKYKSIVFMALALAVR